MNLFVQFSVDRVSEECEGIELLTILWHQNNTIILFLRQSWNILVTNFGIDIFLNTWTFLSIYISLLLYLKMREHIIITRNISIHTRVREMWQVKLKHRLHKHTELNLTQIFLYSRTTLGRWDEAQLLYLMANYYFTIFFMWAAAFE